MTRPLGLALLLAGCGDGYLYDDSELWAPYDPIVVGDAVAVRLPEAGDAVLLRPGAEPERIELGAWKVDDLSVAPDGATLLASVRGQRCDDGDDWDWEFVVDCPYGDLEEERRIEVIAPSDALGSFGFGAWYADLVFSPDSRFAVAPVKPDADVTGGGLVSLDALLVLDLARGKRWEVPVGFRATRFVFTADDAGVTDGMVVLSRSEVATVDLTQDVPLPGTVYPLALEAGATIDPSDVVVTPDDAYALISVGGSSDLYVLDLVDPSINLVGLSAAPKAMVVDADREQTIFAYDRSFVDVLDHVRFDVVRVDLEEPVGHVELLGDHALLWSSTGGREVVRLDLATLRTDRVRLNWPARRLDVAPDGTFAVTLSESVGGRLEVVDLRPDADDRIDSRSRPFGLDGSGVDLAFSGSGADLRVLLLQEGVDQLFSLALPTYGVEVLELDAPPVRLGALADGTFFVTHDDPLGLVSFVGAAGEVSTVADFATLGMFDRDRLVVDEGGAE